MERTQGQPTRTRRVALARIRERPRAGRLGLFGAVALAAALLSLAGSAHGAASRSGDADTSIAGAPPARWREA